LLNAGDGFAGRADEIYEALLRGHEGLTDTDSAALNARLILLLANEAGDPDRVLAAIAAARAAGDPPPNA
jgi:anthranilate phosphoribosyltransferase